MYAIKKVDQDQNIIFKCYNCNYNTCRSDLFNKHLLTRKHFNNNLAIKKVEKVEKVENKYFCCDKCSKKYKSYSGLWRHKKICNNNENNISNENNIIKELKEIILKQQDQIEKQQDQISELIPKIGNNNTINNNKFNINVFLNEQCKDAISINDFVKSIEISLKHLLTTKTKGLGIGLNDIINENMNKLSIYERPIHCTDKKRETLYVKHDNWEKDIDKTHTTNMLKGLQLQQIKTLNIWKEAHPNYMENEELKHEYMILVNKCTKPLSESEKKLFKNLCDNTYIKDEEILIK